MRISTITSAINYFFCDVGNLIIMNDVNPTSASSKWCHWNGGCGGFRVYISRYSDTMYLDLVSTAEPENKLLKKVT